MKRLLLFIASLIFAPSILAQTWKPIVNLNVKGYCDSHDRCVYRTNSGTVYVLVNVSPISSGASSLRIFKSTLQSPTSLTEMNAANHPTDSSRFIGVDGRLNTNTGIISIVYEPTNTVTANYITFNTNTDTWGTPETIATLAGQDGLRYKSHVAMALDASGIPHAIYGGANQGFFYNNRIGGTWSASFQITSNSNDEHPSLVMGLDGVLHLAWFNQTGSRSILYRERSAAGVWSATETVDASVGTFGDPVDQSPSIALDANNLPLILYHEQANINADVLIKQRTAANTYANVGPPIAGPPSTGGHDWAITVTWNGDWIVCGHMMQNPVQPACKTRVASTSTWGSLVIIASGVAKDGSASMRYDPLYPGSTSTIDVEESDENSPESDWFYNAEITPQPPPPTIFFTDLRSGPNSGGQGNLGTFLTIYGTGFGASQGTSTVKVGSGTVSSCPVWGASWIWYQKITCQIGASATTGNVVVTVNGKASNCSNAEEGCSFTVRAGNLLFVSTSGNDTTGNGSFATPWRTLYKAKSTMAAGDIVYARQGIIAASQDQFNSCFDTNRNGTPTNPIAFDVYPGETATIGGVGAPCGNSYRTIESATAGGGPWHDWVIANFNVIEDGAASGNMAMDTQGVTNLRFVGNQIDCLGTNGGQAACWETEAGANNLFAYGNHLRQFATSDKQWHGFYFSTNTNHVWLGWNSIHDGGCRGIQFHSTGAPNQFDLHIHDNLLYNIRCDAINMATIAPQNGIVEVYNNMIFHSGLGPDFGAQGAAAYTCILSAGITNSGSPGTGNMLWYNNTLYDCSSRSTAGGATTQGALGIAASPGVKLNNNTLITIAGDTGGYLSPDASTGVISGSNNNCSGSGNCPASFGTGSVNADPGFVNTSGCSTGTLSSCDLHLSAVTSPATGAGTATQTSLFDRDGLVRPSPPSIGAFEFTSGVATPTPGVSLPFNLAFNLQALGTTSASQTVTLTNSGTATLTITSIVLTGANPSNFSIFSNNCGGSLSASSSCQVLITFHPTALAVYSASLTFTTNASSSPDNVSLNGTGALAGFMLGNGIMSGSGTIKN